jgi:arabinofuranosyltransferase
MNKRKNKKNAITKDKYIKKKSRFRFDWIEKYSIYFIIASLVVLIVVLVKTAWLCDDAYITFRTIDNFVNGYGLRFNVIERVQAYTHPLWLFVISVPYFFFRDSFYTPIIISLLITLIAVVLVVYKFPASKFNSFVFIILLVVSKSFIDYSTSGLENALSHLIAITFIYVYIKHDSDIRKIFFLSLIFSLALLNRMDSILFYLPALSYVLMQSKNMKNIIIILAGLSPIILWTVFSIIYYGYPFPNTYYAKLNTGIPKLELFSQGLYYFYNSLKFDPVTLTAIFVCFIAVLFRRDKKYYPLALGIFLYLLYVVYIGGDFMSGRFFSLPFIFALAILLLSISLKRISAKLSILLSLFLLMFYSPNPPILSGINYTDSEANFVEQNGISDERGYYYHNASLWKAMNGEVMPQLPSIVTNSRLIEKKEKLFLAGAVGFSGYYFGPSVFVMDVYALTDPFLSKFNIVNYDPIFGGAYEKKFKRKPPNSWRIGHFLRPLPPGFTLSIVRNQASFEDQNLNELYKRVKLITQGDIFSVERFLTIIKMNFGRYSYLIDKNKYNEYIETNYHDDLIKSDSTKAYYYDSRATYYFRRKKYEQSVPDYEKALMLDNYNSLAWYKLSIARFFTNNFDGALHCYLNAEKLGEKVDPDFKKAILEKMNNKNNNTANK